MYMVSVMSTLQMMTPDHMRGRVMGFYGMTWSIYPLGGMQAGAVANVIGAPFAVVIGGVAVAAFALGPALLNANIRGLATGATATAEAAPAGERRRVESRSERRWQGVALHPLDWGSIPQTPITGARSASSLERVPLCIV